MIKLQNQDLKVWVIDSSIDIIYSLVINENKFIIIRVDKLVLASVWNLKL